MKQKVNIITDVSTALEALKQETTLGLDIETSGLSFIQDEIAVVSLYGPKSHTAAILHVRGTLPPYLIEFLSSPVRTYILHNGSSFDLPFLIRYGVDLWAADEWFDTLHAETIALSSGRKDLRVSLQASIKRRLNIELAKDAGDHTWMASHLSTSQINYCVDDVQYLPRLRDAQLKCMSPDQERALRIEQNIAPIIIEMSLRGIPFDYSRIHTYKQQLRQTQDQSAEIIDTLLGDVNLASPSQIVKGVHKAVGYTLPATTAEALETMAIEPGSTGQLARAIILQKSARAPNPKDDLEGQSFNGAMYPRYRQVHRDDGHLEINEPDLTKLPPEAHSLFGGVEDHMMVSVQYGNLWWATVAHLARDEGMKQLCKHPLAVALTGVLWPQEDYTYEHEQQCRALLRASLFGHPLSKLEQHLRRMGQDATEAPQLQRLLLGHFPGLSSLHAIARRQTSLAAVPVTFPGGMRRVVANAQPWEVTSLRAKGTVGALIKDTLQEFAAYGQTAYLRAIVGEELLFLVPTEEATGTEWPRIIGGLMEHASQNILGIPLQMDMRIGLYWSL